MLALYVRLQSGVAGYNALYAGFAAIPIFLVWLYAAWMAVLVGAQAGAVDRHAKRVRYEILPQRVDPALEEMLAVAVAAEVTKRFVEGAPPLSKEALAERLHMDPYALDRVLNALVAGGLVTRVMGEHELLGHGLGRDPDTLLVSDVRDAVRNDRLSTQGIDHGFLRFSRPAQWRAGWPSAAASVGSFATPARG